MRKKEKEEHYSLSKILKTNALYYVIFGNRSNGKTYSVLERCIHKYLEDGKRSVYVRRFDNDITIKLLKTLYNPFLTYIKKETKDKYNYIIYSRNGFYLAKINENGEKEYVEDEPFCVTAALNTWEHFKGADRGDFKTLFFDEFITRNYYLTDEFIVFCNIVSTFLRDRDGMEIFLVGNSVNKYNCPYFKEMGLTKAEKMKQGAIDVYTYSDSDLAVAVEYTESTKNTEKVNKYFAFDNPRLHMITSGEWEIHNYPRVRDKLKPQDTVLSFFIFYESKCICCELIYKNDKVYIFAHEQTKEIDISDKISFLCKKDGNPLHMIKLNECGAYKASAIIQDCIVSDNIVFSDNEIGELFRNWLMFQNSYSYIKC